MTNAVKNIINNAENEKDNSVFIDCSFYPFGRISSYAAKMALKGYKVFLLNVEKIIITGSKKQILERFVWKRSLQNKANPEHSPKLPRVPHLMVKRMVRGMLPYKTKRGREAYKRIKAYIGIPEEFKDKKLSEIPIERKQYNRYVTIQEICAHLGYKS
ncbi:MAG: 50S ribosomal protein L13 [Candidatus Anstonellales archaeon]